MRKITLIAIAVLIAVTVWAQSPAKMSYQAVIRDASNALVVKHGVGMRISILQGSVTGPAVYSETQTPETNANGLVSIEFGGREGFDAIDWAKGPYFIKTETDPTGGTNYTITGTSQLLTVPYAMYAKTAGNGFSGDYNDLANKPTVNGSETKVTGGTNVTVTGEGTTSSPYTINSTGVGGGFSHYVGELYGGGIVVAVWKAGGVEHGLIASLIDLSSGAAWSNVTTEIVALAQSPSDGFTNTKAIIAQAGHTSSAAKLCVDYTAGGNSDWYLPSIWELNLCYNAAFVVNVVLGSTDGFQNADYWASSDEYADIAWMHRFGRGDRGDTYKSSLNRVRAVRRF